MLNIAGNSIECLVVVGDSGDILASGGSDNTIDIWDTRSGLLVRTMGVARNRDPLKGHTSEWKRMYIL